MPGGRVQPRDSPHILEKELSPVPDVLERAVETVETPDGTRLRKGEGRDLSVETRALPDLLTVGEAARMLRVSDATVRNWIEADCIPYVKLPNPGAGRKQHRIPLQGLLSSLEGTYDLRDALHEQSERMREADLPED